MHRKHQMPCEAIILAVLTQSWILKWLWVGNFESMGHLQPLLRRSKCSALTWSVSLSLFVSTYLSLSLSQTHAHVSAYTHTFSQENWRNGGITKACSGSTHYFGINASVIPDASPDDKSECCNKGCVSDYLDTCHA